MGRSPHRRRTIFAPRRIVPAALVPDGRAARAGLVCGLAILCGTSAGCEVFKQNMETFGPSLPGSDDYDPVPDPRVTPFRPVIDQISLDVWLVERPEDDLLLGRALWDSVGEIGAVDAERADKLRAAGFRVGVASADPPEAVRALIERKETVGTPLPNTRFGNGHYDGASVQRIPLRAGGDTTLPTVASRGDLRVLTPVHGDKPARTESFETAAGAVRVGCRTPRKGWVTLDLTPEVHHGPVAMRAVAGAAGLQTSHGQRVRAWPDLSFEVTLTGGDSVILGLREDAAPDSLAAALLASEQNGHATDRILVVRLAEVRQIEGHSVGQ